MNQTFGCSQEADESAEIHNFGNHAMIDFAFFRFGNNTHNPFQSGLAVFFFNRSDFNNAIVGNINFGIGLFGNFTDNLTAGTDDVADLVGRNLDGDDTRSGAARGVTRLGDHIEHLLQDEGATLLGLLQGAGQDVEGEAGRLVVHLQGGNALGGAGDLKVHVAQMVFITAGMGGGTGTGASPVIAKLAKEMGMLTVGIVTSPLAVEGKIRYEQAFRGIEELRQNVDSLLIINNENILEIYGRLALKQAFGKADDILASAAKGIAEIITVESDLVNVDFADVSKVMRDSGRAHMSVATAEGDNRAEAVAEASLHSPLLDHNLISGARNILLNISVANAEELMYEEVVRILEYIQAHASVEDESGNIHNANIIWGTSEKPQLGNAIELVVVATGFEGDEEKRMMKTVIPPARIVKPVPEGADPAGKPVLEPVGKPGKATPQTRPLEQVILGEKSTRYSNIDQILAKPAYQSRKAQFIVEMPAGRKEVLKEEKGAAERAEENRSESLFD